MPEDGINAISLLMQTLYKHEGRTEKDIVSFYHDCIGMEIDGSHLIGVEPDEISGPATVNPGVIKLENSIVELQIDIRYPVSSSYDEIMKRIERIAKTYDMKCAVDVHKLPVHLSLDNPFAKGLLRAYQTATGDDSNPISIGGGTYARAIKNVVAFGPVFPGRELTEHEPDEYAYLEDLHLIRKIYREALCNI
jgi:succinyl-diaminopimelate desuccinylase